MGEVIYNVWVYAFPNIFRSLLLLIDSYIRFAKNARYVDVGPIVKPTTIEQAKAATMHVKRLLGVTIADVKKRYGQRLDL